MSKYRNKKTVVDGITFDSQKEARRYSELVLLQEAGKISCLECQRAFVLVPSVVMNNRKKPAVKYIADFYYLCRQDNGYIAEIVEDVKSAATKALPIFRLKAHLMKQVHDLEITIV